MNKQLALAILIVGGMIGMMGAWLAPSNPLQRPSNCPHLRTCDGTCNEGLKANPTTNPTTNPAMHARAVEHDGHIYIETISRRDGKFKYDHHLSCPCWPKSKPGE